MRNINALSGLICTGKSAYMRKLMRLPEFRDAISVSLDDVGIRHWGRRIMTSTEKVYRNQLAREEVQRRIIVNGVQTVLLEMVMLTRKNHQEPFVRMVAKTEQYLHLIEPERAGKRTWEESLSQWERFFLFMDEVEAIRTVMMP